MSSDQKKQDTKNATRDLIRPMSNNAWHAGLLLGLPIAYVVHRLIQNRVSHQRDVAISLIITVGFGIIFEIVIPLWLRKKPYNSKWHFWLG